MMGDPAHVKATVRHRLRQALRSPPGLKLGGRRPEALDGHKPPERKLWVD